MKNQLRSRGVNNAKAVADKKLKEYGILDSKGKLTAKGRERNSMSPGDRAKDRAVKYSSKPRRVSEYKYNKKTNRATLK